jgi:hypothetical protein
MMPPVGAIIIGPCPQCNELVVVFCGHVLPLEKQIMETAPVEERREHLLSVLTEFLQDRIGKLMTDEPDSAIEGEAAAEGESDLPAPAEGAEEAAVTDSAKRGNGLTPISKSEIERFASIDLKLLDNKAYFKSVFEG